MLVAIDKNTLLVCITCRETTIRCRQTMINKTVGARMSDEGLMTTETKVSENKKSRAVGCDTTVLKYEINRGLQVTPSKKKGT